MEQKELREQEAKCTQEQPAACTAFCPLHVDVRGMVTAVRKGDFAAGFAVLSKMVPFPKIISRICDHPCQTVCKRSEVGETVQIHALEQACATYNSKPRGKVTRIPQKSEQIAVVGAGLSGLTVAVDLLKKGYQVTIFEAGVQLGGHIRKYSTQVLPETVIEDDFAVLAALGANIHVNTKVSGEPEADKTLANLCNGFDAVYLGIGDQKVASLALDLDTNASGHIEIAPVTFETSREKIFAGGSQRYEAEVYSPSLSMADGRRAAISIDRYLQQASLTASRSNEEPYETSLYTELKSIAHKGAVIPVDATSGYNEGEAQAEAERCLLCECLECVKACEFMAHYRSYPKRDLREVYNNLSIVQGIHHANTKINSCSLCGLCAEICPGKLDMGQVYKEARQMMVAKGNMPPTLHDFALRDLQFSQSEAFTLARHQPGFTTSEILFFPSCQLSASSPEQVKKTYRYLQEKYTGGVGLLLGCCGAPADWAGRMDLFAQAMEQLINQWRQLGKPRIITGCATCYSLLKTHVPDLEVETLWTVFAREGLPQGVHKVESGLLAIHDTCTTRHEQDIHESVRGIIKELGFSIEELEHSREMTECCGYGGLMSQANREVADKVIQKRITQSAVDYVTYCAMCRDNFAAKGKRAVHILDLIYGMDEEMAALRKKPGYSERHENRARLKRELLQEIWGEKSSEIPTDVNLLISEEVFALMEDRMILVEDIQTVIAYAERTGKKMRKAGADTYIVYCKPTRVTYWVEYAKEATGFRIHNAYSHRMEIIRE